jgi:hypothetical protein
VSISSAIAATAPSIWYPLTGGGGTIVNSGSQSNNATGTGVLSGEVAGPEFDTTATRFYAGDLVVSHQMDLTTFVGQSLGFWASTDASGVLNTRYPIVNIGDPANRLARGPIISEQHATSGIPAYTAQYGTSVTTSGSPGQPLRFWHWIVVTYATGSSGVKLYIDGTLVGSLTVSAPSNPLATDCLMIKCDEPIVLAHVCWWGGVLTATQVASVSNELAPWPYSPPVNTPPPTADTGGGGLTDDQAAQLTAIDTKTDDIPGLVSAATFISDKVNEILGWVTDTNAGVETLLSNWAGYTSVTLPSLQDVLDNISGAVQGALTTAEGAIGATVGQLLSQRSSDTWSAISLTDGMTCEPVSVDLSRQAIHGLQLYINAYPEGWRFKTPDRAWSLRDLAVLRFYQGGQLLERHGVHTIQHHVSPLPGAWSPQLLDITGARLPNAYVVTVDWAEGVCGELQAQVTP